MAEVPADRCLYSVIFDRSTGGNYKNVKREERISTRCNHIDDLLSFPDVDY